MFIYFIQIKNYVIWKISYKTHVNIFLILNDFKKALYFDDNQIHTSRTCIRNKGTLKKLVKYCRGRTYLQITFCLQDVNKKKVYLALFTN